MAQQHTETVIISVEVYSDDIVSPFLDEVVIHEVMRIYLGKVALVEL